ncbi:MAG: hypothetical protein QG578_912 [Thermodesulfobacteriota bacterium]|nr:hypothetical protein [Thermodesulfobacteriota bacterium]
MEQSQKALCTKTDYRKITVKTSDGSTIQGKVNVDANQRVSDLFTKSEAPFIVMIDVSYRDGVGKILFVNKRHIIWIEPEDSEETKQDIC